MAHPQVADSLAGGLAQTVHEAFAGQCEGLLDGGQSVDFHVHFVPHPGAELLPVVGAGLRHLGAIAAGHRADALLEAGHEIALDFRPGARAGEQAQQRWQCAQPAVQQTRHPGDLVLESLRHIKQVAWQAADELLAHVLDFALDAVEETVVVDEGAVAAFEMIVHLVEGRRRVGAPLLEQRAALRALADEPGDEIGQLGIAGCLPAGARAIAPCGRGKPRGNRKHRRHPADPLACQVLHVADDHLHIGGRA